MPALKVAHLMQMQAQLMQQAHRIRTLEADLARVSEERDTYAEGLHQLKGEMFEAKLRPFAHKAANSPTSSQANANTDANANAQPVSTTSA